MVLEPSDCESEHEKLLWYTIESLHIDFPENFNVVVWTWNNLYRGIEVPGSWFWLLKMLW